MNKKGFTLVELTAVVLVIGLIFLVSFPIMTNMSKKSNKEQQDKMEEDICLAGKSYIYANISKYPNLSTEGSKILINVTELIEYGNLDENIKNPSTGESIVNSEVEYTVSDDLSLICNFKNNG